MPGVRPTASSSRPRRRRLGATDPQPDPPARDELEAEPAELVGLDRRDDRSVGSLNLDGRRRRRRRELAEQHVPGAVGSDLDVDDEVGGVEA